MRLLRRRPRLFQRAAARILFLEIFMLSVFRRLMKNDHGATAIEYTLIASLIAVATIAAMGSVGTKVNGVLTNVASNIK
jgi:pilus assembly protein Flp/PilA